MRVAGVSDRAGEYGLPPRRLLVAIWAALWAGYGLWTLRAGLHTSVDSLTYSRWADLLIANHFNLSAYLHAQDFYIPPFLYTGWIIVVATLKSAFGTGWMQAVPVLNWLAFGAGTYVLLSAIRHLTGSAASVLLSAYLLCVASDLLIFMPFVLSDLTFWGMATTVIVFGSRLAASDFDEDHVIRTALTGSALVLVAVFFRPGGLTLIIFWVAALASAFVRRPFDRFTTALSVAVAIGALIVIGCHAAIVIDPRVWPFDGLSHYFAVISQDYHAGVLVDAPESDLAVAPAVTWLGALRLTMQKAIYFMTPWLPSYSRSHTLMNLAFFLPAYGLTIAAVINRTRLSARQQRAIVVLMLFIFSGVVSHALIQLDYDHRYRMPMLSALIVLASLGLESLRRPPRLG